MKILDTLGKTKKAIGGVVAICILAAVIFFAGTVFGGKQSEPKITSTALTQQLQEVSDLAVMEYNYTKVGKFENSLTLNGWNIPLTKKSFLLTYAGQLKAGVRMEQAEVDVKGNTITVLLPEVEILSNIIDERASRYMMKPRIYLIRSVLRIIRHLLLSRRIRWRMKQWKTVCSARQRRNHNPQSANSFR